jgi:hypothetical protein
LGDPNWPSASDLTALFETAPQDGNLAPFLRDFLAHYDDRDWLHCY